VASFILFLLLEVFDSLFAQRAGVCVTIRIPLDFLALLAGIFWLFQRVLLCLLNLID